eukprot:4661261-Prymnesium_polylepis.1
MGAAAAEVAGGACQRQQQHQQQQQARAQPAVARAASVCRVHVRAYVAIRTTAQPSSLSACRLPA